MLIVNSGPRAPPGWIATFISGPFVSFGEECLIWNWDVFWDFIRVFFGLVFFGDVFSCIIY